MANSDIIKRYKIVSSSGVDLNGIIIIEDRGFEKQATTSFQDTTPGGISININFEGEPSMFGTPEQLSNVALVSLNNILEGQYNIPGDLQKELIPPTQDEIAASIEKGKTPKYQLEATTSDVKGTITFEQREDGYSANGLIYNLPPDFIQLEQELGSPPIIEANYDELKVYMLKDMNIWLSDYPEFGVFEIVETTFEDATKWVDYVIYGKVIDKPNLTPIIGAKIEDDEGFDSETSNNGEFKLSGAYVEFKTFKISISSKDYTQSSITPFRQDGSLKKDIGVIPLIPLNASVEDEKLEVQELTDEQKQQLKKSKRKDFVQTQVDQLINKIKTTLLPAIIQQIQAFGVSKLAELQQQGMDKFEELKATCPSDIEGLNELIEKKNQLTKQLNNIFKAIERIANFLNIPDQIISATEKAIPPLKIAVKIPAFLPSTVATPNPVGPILIAEDAIKLLGGVIAKFSGKLGAGKFQLDFLIAEMEKVLKMLSSLDTLIQGCAEEIGGETEGGEVLAQEQISQELFKSTQEQSNQLSPVVNNVNGFKMGVEEEYTNKPLKRRRAIAQNTQGVTMLKGEWSFSSNDQILINELVFYIQQNDLKT
jgi:hypothetical protein